MLIYSLPTFGMPALRFVKVNEFFKMALLPQYSLTLSQMKEVVG